MSEPSSSPIPTPSAAGRAPWTRDPAWLAALTVTLIALAIAPGAIDNIDTRIAFRSAQSLLSHGTFALENPTPLEREFLWTGMGQDGEVYSKFGAGLSLTLVPFVALGRLLALALPIPAVELEEFMVALSSCVFTGAAVWGLVRIGTDHLRLSRTASVVGALSWAFATYQLSYSGSSYLETPLATCAVLGVWASLECRTRPGAVAPALLAGFFAGWLVAIKVAMVVVMPFLLLPLLANVRDGDRSALFRRLVLVGIPLALIAGWLMTLNTLRFGGPLDTGYVAFDTLFRTPLAKGLGGYAVDPDLSILLYAPAFTIGLFGVPALVRRNRWFFAAAVGVLVSGAILHALHTGYHGGTCYGPRYLVSAIPLLTAGGVASLAEGALGAGPARRAVLALALAAGVVLQLPSVFVSGLEYHTLKGTVRDRGGSYDAIHPRPSVDWQLLGKKLTGDVERYDLAEFIDDPAQVPAESAYDVPRMDRGPAIWWLLAAREGRAWAWGPGLLLLLGGAGAGVLLMRYSRS